MKKEIVYLGMLMTNKPSWEGHIKRRKKAARKWVWKTKSIARKKGKAPIEVEEVLRKGGERASEGYGGELWISMKGKRYDQEWASQAQVEKAMRGMSRWSPTCLACDLQKPFLPGSLFCFLKIEFFTLIEEVRELLFSDDYFVL